VKLYGVSFLADRNRLLAYAVCLSVSVYLY